MKKHILVIVGLVATGVATTTMAADTKDIKVTAAVVQNCKINTADDIGFGSLDPAIASNATATGGVVFVCTKNVDFSLTADNGSHWDGTLSKRRMKGADSNYLPYTLAQSSFTGKGMGFGVPVNVTLSASILGSDYRDLPADSYMDNLRVSINP